LDDVSLAYSTTLLQVCQNANPKARQAAAEALEEIKDPTVASLLQLLKNEYNRIRFRAAMLLEEPEDTRTVDPLLHTLQTEE